MKRKEIVRPEIAETENKNSKSEINDTIKFIPIKGENSNCQYKEKRGNIITNSIII